MSALLSSGKKRRDPRSPTRENESEKERKKRKAKEAATASRQNKGQRNFDRLLKTKVLFLLPDHGHDEPEVILPKSSGVLPEYFKSCIDPNLPTWDPYNNYDCLEMNRFTNEGQDHSIDGSTGVDVPVYFNVQDEWDFMEENYGLDDLIANDFEPFQPEFPKNPNAPLNVTYLNHIVGLVFKFRLDSLLKCPGYSEEENKSYYFSKADWRDNIPVTDTNAL